MTVWGAAQERVRGWEASGQVGVIRNEIPAIKEAVQKHIADAGARNLKPESLKKIRDVIERRFLKYAPPKVSGASASSTLTSSASSGIAWQGLLGQLRAQEAGVRALVLSVLASIRLDDRESRGGDQATEAGHSPTLPFEQKQIDAILAVADTFNTRGSSALRALGRRDGKQLHAGRLTYRGSVAY
jgi:hypothetical protein